MKRIILAVTLLVLKNKQLFFVARKMVRLLSVMEKIARQRIAGSDIVAAHNKLLELVLKMRRKGEICFGSGEIKPATGGNHWLFPRVSGLWAFEKFRTNKLAVMKIMKAICDDYQKVIRKFVGIEGDFFGSGKRWLFGNILKWSGPIVEAGYMTHDEVLDIIRSFEKAIDIKGKDFFGYAHGNIIGNHVLVGPCGELYLSAMRITVRPGKGYYDFLRTLDWFFLHQGKDEKDFRDIVSWISEFLLREEYDPEEVKLVFALRCMGVLGWDILHRREHSPGGKCKIDMLLRFIRRDYVL